MKTSPSPAPGPFPNGRLLVFAKAPEQGRVKTRLTPSLGAQGCALLQQRLIERTLRMATRAALCPVELWCAPDCTNPFFDERARLFKIDMCPQTGKGLGMRMYHALSITLSQAEFALIIGCDCPVLDVAYLTRACDLLADGVPVVLGPAEDGGYVLIGARRTARRLFEGIDWGTPRVLGQTRERLRSLDWRWCELEMLWDIDRPGDLDRLATEGLDTLGVLTPSPTLASRQRSGDKTAPP